MDADRHEAIQQILKDSSFPEYVSTLQFFAMEQPFCIAIGLVIGKPEAPFHPSGVPGLFLLLEIKGVYELPIQIGRNNAPVLYANKLED